MKSLYFILCNLLLLVCSSLQAQDGFNPGNPDEPDIPVFYYSLTTICEPDEAGVTSGNGNYAPGSSITVSTSSNVDYTFSHWTLNGERIEQPTSFSFTTVEGPMVFVAHYNLTPGDPEDPTMDVKSRLFLISDPVGVCTFNRTSGAFVQADDYVEVDVTNTDQWYEFTGWYQDGNLVSSEQNFNYLVGYSDATLVARFRQLEFTPFDPSEPASQGGNIQNHKTGDANEDGSVDVTDAVAVINAYLTNDTSSINVGVADVNHDGIIDITDAVAIINLYLNSQ